LRLKRRGQARYRHTNRIGTCSDLQEVWAVLRITTLTGNGAGPILRLEGKLLEPWLDELRRACAALAVPPNRLYLDLAAVTFVDSAGVRLLRELLQQNVAIIACSAFVAALLERECP
jgi:ABC-type transporter Mla MlaB component